MTPSVVANSLLCLPGSVLPCPSSIPIVTRIRNFVIPLGDRQILCLQRFRGIAHLIAVHSFPILLFFKEWKKKKKNNKPTAKVLRAYEKKEKLFFFLFFVFC